MDGGEEQLNPLAVCAAVALVLASLFAGLLSLLLLPTGAAWHLLLLWLGPIVGWVAATRRRFVTALLGAASPFVLLAAGFWALGQLSQY